MSRFALIAAVLALAGCSSGTPDPPPSGVARSDSTVLVTTIDEAVSTALERYVDVSNLIASDGGARPERIESVTTPAWAVEEKAGYRVLAALDPETATTIDIVKTEIAFVRGVHVVVDAYVHVCFRGGEQVTLATVRLVPVDGDLVVDNIEAWEESMWCGVASES